MAKQPTKYKTRTNNTSKSNFKQSKLDFLSWKVLVPALILFAAVGGYFVYSTSASSRAWEVHAYATKPGMYELSGGKVVYSNAMKKYYRVMPDSYVGKDGGIKSSYRMLFGATVSKIPNKTRNNTIPCAYFRVSTHTATVELRTVTPRGKATSIRTETYSKQGGKHWSICSRERISSDVQTVMLTLKSGSIQLNKIYGNR